MKWTRFPSGSQKAHIWLSAFFFQGFLAEGGKAEDSQYLPPHPHQDQHSCNTNEAMDGADRHSSTDPPTGVFCLACTHRQALHAGFSHVCQPRHQLTQ